MPELHTALSCVCCSALQELKRSLTKGFNVSASVAYQCTPDALVANTVRAKASNNQQSALDVMYTLSLKATCSSTVQLLLSRNSLSLNEITLY